MSESLLEKAKTWRELVLLAELGGWLHDLGKLSSGFVREHEEPAYNPPSEEERSLSEEEEAKESPHGKGEEKWHHERIFEYDARVLPDALEEVLRRPLTGADGWLKGREARLGSDRVGLGDLVRGHHRESWENLVYLQRLLRRADGEDSGEDEYNAVGLPQREPVQAATVFGREEPLAGGDLKTLDAARLALYPQLAEALTQPDAPEGEQRKLWDPLKETQHDRDKTQRQALWELLKKTLQHGLGKTQRAANDVRLDQHAWGVAARFKAFLLRDLLDPPPDKQHPRRTFRLLTVWWDSWELITPFARLSDVVGREVMLEELRKTLLRVIEEEYALGNRVYEDNDGVHFLVADLPWDMKLTGLVRGVVNQATDGEVRPVVRLGPPTERVTDLVAQMDEARREVPVVGDPAWARKWEDSPSGEVCPVCQRRPLEGDRDLCPWCEQRRWAGIKRRLGKGTVWTGEIADANKRVALIVARFDLERWLDGTMLHTLFITSPQDIAQRPESGKRYPADASWCTLFDISSLSTAHGRRTENASTWDWTCLRDLFPHLDEGRAEVEQQGAAEQTHKEKVKQRKQLLEEQEKVQGHRQYIAGNDRIPQERKAMLLQQDDNRLAEINRNLEAIASDLADLEQILSQPLSPVGMLVSHLQSKPGQEKRVQVLTADLRTRYDLSPEDAFLLALARKNPSASRLLRVWQTTEEFLQEQADRPQGFPPQQRVVFTLGDMEGKPPPSGIYTAEVPGLGRVDIFVRPKNRKAQTITRLKKAKAQELQKKAPGQTLRLKARETGQALDEPYTIIKAETEDYHPYQVITVSPNLLLMMAPADRAMDVAEAMQRAYAEEFGKVQGRLPFHVGLIFMDAHYPMFAALDTARRLGETFDRLAGEYVEATLDKVCEKDDGFDLTLRNDRFGPWTWHVPARRGDGEVDWYHPYFLVRGEKESLGERGMSLKGPQGWWVHVSKLQKGDRIAFWPNFFDFLFLDTVSRRFAAHVHPETKRRPHALLGEHHSPRPYLLERVHHLRGVWEDICKVKGMSETRLEAAVSLLSSKWEAWQLAAPDSPPRQAAWESHRWLVEQVVARDFRSEEGSEEKIEDKIREAILSGSFFDAVELYRHILKQSITRQSRK